MTHNLPLSPGWYARLLEPDELDPIERIRAKRYGSSLEPVELIRVYGVKNCPLSYGKFWDTQSARDYVAVNFYPHSICQGF